MNTFVKVISALILIMGFVLFVNAGTVTIKGGTINATHGMLVNGSTLYVDSVNGRVGIGTTSPTATLHVSSSNAAGSLLVQNTTGSAFLFVNGTTGNVGIGTTAPTVQFERVCPSGFTNVKAANNQLGCMETAEHGTGSFFTAANTCFTTYGGRLPIYSEWYVTMVNYNLTDEVDWWEWLGDSGGSGSVSMCNIVGSTTLLTPYGNPCDDSFDYRCWIPR